MQCVSCGQSLHTISLMSKSYLLDTGRRGLTRWLDRMHNVRMDTTSSKRPGTKARSVRVEDELWDAALARALERGENVSEAVRRALKRYTR